MNGNSVDLNRNFPDYFTPNIDMLQPETDLIMKWINETQFVLSAAFSSGALVTTYPYDNNGTTPNYITSHKLECPIK